MHLHQHFCCFQDLLALRTSNTQRKDSQAWLTDNWCQTHCKKKQSKGIKVVSWPQEKKWKHQCQRQSLACQMHCMHAGNDCLYVQHVNKQRCLALMQCIHKEGLKNSRSLAVMSSIDVIHPMSILLLVLSSVTSFCPAPGTLWFRWVVLKAGQNP